jgi:hypothetical protein
MANYNMMHRTFLMATAVLCLIPEATYVAARVNTFHDSWPTSTLCTEPVSWPLTLCVAAPRPQPTQDTISFAPPA